MNKRKREAFISIILVTFIVIALNIFASDNFYRADFTKGGIYTIGDSTRNILANLDGNLHIKFYVSRDMPPRVTPIKRNLLDILSEYQRYGRGSVRLSILNPDNNADIENDARMAGIQQIQLNVISQNREELQSAYMGIALYYEDRSEVIPVIMSINDVEFQLTSAILKLTGEKNERIVFLDKKPNLPPDLDPQMRAQLMAQMPPGRSIHEDTRAVAQALKEMYVVEEKKISEGEFFTDDTSIVVIHEAANLTPWEKFAVDQFVMGGGRLIVLQSGLQISQQGFAQARSFNYEDMLKSYGFELNKDMVHDLFNYSVMVPQGNMRFMTPYPLWIKVGPDQIGEDFPGPVRDSGTLAFSFASSISLNKVDGVRYRTLARSSGKSWTEAGMVVLDPTQIQTPSKSRFDVYDLAVLGEGGFKSHFTEDTLPEIIKESGGNFIERAAAGASVLLISSPEFILDTTMRNFRSNGIFFLNMVDYLTNSTELMNIRSRGDGYTFINPRISENAKVIIKWIGILLMPILVVIFGIFRMIWRNKLSGRVS